MPRSLLAAIFLLFAVACGPAATPTPKPTVPAPSPTGTAAPAPTATPTPAPAASAVVICNTGGMGAFIRTEPKGSGIMAWPDNTKLAVVGADRNVDGEVWRNVQDDKGSVGWIKKDYLCPAG